MADFAISTMFTAGDRVTRTLGKMIKASTKFGDKTSRAFNKASKSGSRFQSIVSGILSARAIAGGFRLVARELGEMTTGFISFDDAITAAAAKFKDIDVTSENITESMDALRKAARKTGAETEFTATQAGKGLDFFALAGFKADQAMTLLTPTVNLATVAEIDLARASDIASDALGAFGLMTDDTSQLQKNFIRLTDVMTLTMTRSNTTIEDMFEAMKKGAPLLNIAGQSLETFNALLGSVAGNTLKASEAGTQFRNMVLRLVDSTPEAMKELKKYNIQTLDSKGNFRDMIDIFADVEKGLEGVASGEKLAALKRIFGIRSITAASILLQRGTKSVRDFKTQLLEGAGATEIMALFMRTSLGNSLKAVKSALTEIAFRVFDVFRERGRTAIQSFTEAIREVDLSKVIAFLETLWGNVKNLADAFEPVVTTLLPIAGTLFSALTETLKILKPILPALAVGWLTYKIAMIAATVAQTLLNVAMTANPIGLLIAGIGLLIAAGVALYQNWDTIKATLSSTWRFIKDQFNTLIRFMVDKFAWVARAALVTAKAVASVLGVNTDAIDAMLAGIDEIQLKVNRALPTEAPNAADIEARERLFRLTGQINIAGAPPGSTVETSQFGGTKIDMLLLQAGLNP